MASLLEPGSRRAEGVADDAALVDTMLRVEVAWLRVLADAGAAEPAHVDAVTRAAAEPPPVLAPRDVEDAGNPVLPLVRALRERVDDPGAAALVHAGLTSQDVLDSAVMLLARRALDRIEGDLRLAAAALAELADRHRGTVMAGRTLTQYAVPVTFGLKAAQWLTGILDAAEALAAVSRRLPIQCGGAAGTLARAGDLAERPTELAASFAAHLDLAWPGLPWHTRRTPVTRLGDSLVEACDALGVLATNVLTLGRPEIAEVREGAVAGRGASSTMPHKQNPVLSVLVHAAALQAPQLGAQLHVAAAAAVDERPDGAWHAEWPSLRRLLELTVTAAAQAAELAAGLEVDAEAMGRRAKVAAAQQAERGARAEPSDHLGASDAFVDAALARARNRA